MRSTGSTVHFSFHFLVDQMEPLRGNEALDKFFHDLYKGGNLYIILFCFPVPFSLLKRDLLCKFLFLFRLDPSYQGWHTCIYSVRASISLENISHILVSYKFTSYKIRLSFLFSSREKYVYLMGRSPLPINSNYYVLDQAIFCPTSDQVVR